MTEGLDQDAAEREEAEPPVVPGGAEALFGDYSVLSPGVQIVLEGRAVSAPAVD